MARFYKKLLFLFFLLVILAMPQTSRSQECEKMKISDFPKKDLPSGIDLGHIKPADIKDDEACKYYYGIGVPVDYEKARHFAFMEMAALNGKEDPLEGSSILLMLYANGFGVQRNLDISIRLACANVSGATAEVEGRLQHLKDIQSGKNKEVFDICDDATSGYMSGFCSSVQTELAEIARKAAMDSVIKRWPEPSRLAYKRLREAASGFFSERLNSEVDESGTARVWMVDQESEALEDGFKSEMMDADKCNFTTYSAQDYAAADKELNSLYSRIMTDKDFSWGTVTKEGIRATQRKWIRYRDAWVEFGAVRCPGVTAASWNTLITQERIAQLREFIDE